MQPNMQQSGSFATRNVVFVVLLIVSLVLAGVYSQEGESGPLHAAQSGVMGVTGQAAGVGAGVGAATGGAAKAASDVTANPSTLSALREQNEELRELLADTEEYRQEINRLRDLLDMKQVSGVTGPVARIIGRSTNAWDQSITIDLGTADGVTSGMTVMGSNGVVGQVSRASEHSSSVRLLSDPNSGAAVMVQSSRANGVVRGSLSGLLYLEDVDEDKLPEVGDVIVTSGLGGSYERGLIVGSVVSLGDSSSTSSIVVNPNDNAEMLEEVVVVFKAPQTINSASSSSSSASAQTQDQAQAQDQTQDQADGTTQDEVTTEDVSVSLTDDQSGVDQSYVDQSYTDQTYTEETYVDQGEGASEDQTYVEG